MIGMEQARSVARALLVKVKVQSRPHAIVLMSGEPVIRRCEQRDHLTRDVWTKYPNVLVGIYDGRARLDDIADDIVAADRGEYSR